MKRWFPAALAALGGLGPWAAACSAQHGSPGAQGTYDASEADTSSPTTEGGGDAAADDDASPTQTYLRIAHVSPDMPPIDVCVALHGTGSYQGPLIGQLAATNAGDAGEDAEGGGADDDAGLPGVSYAQVSAYLPLDPGDYDVRIVAAGASSCDASTAGGAAVPDSTNLPVRRISAALEVPTARGSSQLTPNSVPARPLLIPAPQKTADSAASRMSAPRVRHIPPP